ncbi:amidohydrolase family protein [Pseudofrankia sp. DC12]|uniref:amidohydrolase family protein n=1 Tax=Pseudofrankia sp. DC12 TaxID=683315 RepID=UPI000AC4806C|nr:amidohydrolase family protein [Pseudofrankia sp. DC12]
MLTRDPGEALRVRLPRIETLPLVDHHCHGLVRRELDRADFERAMTEADHPAPAGTSFFDSQLGLALRRWCAPVLDLAPHAEPDDYLGRRAELGPDEVATRMLRAAGIEELCVDTGFAPERLTGAADLAGVARARAHDVVRLEPLAEQVALDIVTGQVGVAHFPDLVRSRLAARTGREEPPSGAAERPAGAARKTTRTGSPAGVGVVGVKSVAAYRVGLDLPSERPTDRAVIASVRGWVSQLRAGAPIRLADPVLHSFLIWAGADLGLPVQIHTGFGDTDLHLARANPLLLTDLLRELVPTGAPVLLLHCYPYHREAGYLAQVFPHVYVDVGLATHNLGRGSATVLAETLELAPFGKMLFSTDAFALAELYLLGAKLFRRGLGSFLAAGVEADDWTARDADRVATMIGAGNARRVYGLAEPAPDAEPAPPVPPAARPRPARPRPAASKATTSKVATAKATSGAKAATSKAAKPAKAANPAKAAKPAKAAAQSTAPAGEAAAADAKPAAAGRAAARKADASDTTVESGPGPKAGGKAESEQPPATGPRPKGPSSVGGGAGRSRRRVPGPISLIKEPRGKEHHRSPKPPRSRTHGTASHPKTGDTG